MRRPHPKERRLKVAGKRSRLALSRRRQRSPAPRIAGDCGNEALACVGVLLPARLQHMPHQEQTGELEAVEQIALRPAAVRRVIPQERRQPQQFVPPRLPRLARHRSAGFRRHVDEVVGCTGRRTVGEIETETEFGEHRQFEPHRMNRRVPHVVEIVQDAFQHLIDIFVRIAFRQQPRQRRQMGDAINGVRGGQHGRGAQPDTVELIVAEVLVEARAPHRADRIARLQRRAHPRSAAAAHHAEMTAVRARQQFDDGVGLAMPPHAQYDAFIDPFHGWSRIPFTPAIAASKRSFLRLFLGKLQTHFAIALGIIAPAVAHLHEQEQVHRLTDDLGDLLARIGADRLDGRPALAEHDLALAFTLDENRLLDANGLVLALGPAVGFDGGLIRQFLMQLAIDLFAGDLGRQMPDRRVRHLIFRIVKRTRGHRLRQRTAQVIDAVAGDGRDHEGLFERQPRVGSLRQQQQLLARDEIDLVDHQDLGVRHAGEPGQDRIGFLVEAGARIQQHAHQIGIVRAAPRGRDHGAVQPSLGREDPRRVDQDDLRLIFHDNAANQRPRGLHLARHDRDLGADQRIDQRRFSDIGCADQGHETAARRGGMVGRLSHHCCRSARLPVSTSPMPRASPPRACCRRRLRPASGPAIRPTRGIADRDAGRCARPRDRPVSAGPAPAPIPAARSWHRAAAAPACACARSSSPRRTSQRPRSRRRETPRRSPLRRCRREPTCATARRHRPRRCRA